MNDPLGPTQPHTVRPGVLGEKRPTCSRRTQDNAGCGYYPSCPVAATRDAGAGPVQVALEDNTEVPFGEGRRFAMWCFLAAQIYLNPKNPTRVSMCQDRVYHSQKPSSEGGGPLAVRLPAYEEQGPYYWEITTAAAPDYKKLRQDLLEGDSVDRKSDKKRRGLVGKSDGS